MTSSENSSFQNKNESSEKRDTNINPFDSSSYQNGKEGSKKGSLKSYQNSEISQDIHEISEENQNNNISSGSEGLIDNDSFIEEKENNEDFYYLLYNNSLDNKENIDYIPDILEESIIPLIINNNKENKIKFGNIKYKDRETTYEKLITPSKEGQKQQFKYNKNSKDYKKINTIFSKIKDNVNKYYSKINLVKELMIIMKLKEDKNTKTINSEYFIDEKFLIIKKQYQDTDILKDDNYLEGFASFLEEIIKKNQATNNDTSTKLASSNKQKNIFISLIKIIRYSKSFAQKIWELDDDTLVSDGIIEYKIEDINQDEKNVSNNVANILTGKKVVKINFKNESISLKKKSNTNIPNIEELYPCRNLLILRRCNYLIYNKTIYYGSDIFIRLNEKKKFFILSEMDYIGGIKLNDDYIAFTSNNTLSKGENKLFFFNSKSEKFMEEFEIENYSFTLSENNSSIMRKPKHENIKLLLVACKKNNENEQNGILLINLQFNGGNIEKKYHEFYDTKYFEVYCFCPIVEIDKTNMDKKIETEYFLVGVYDSNQKQGLIKLYEVKYNDEIEKIKIEFIQDIIIEKKKGEKDSEGFKGFKGPISCIIQSPKGEILVTCYDGNVYLFSEPNFEKKTENEDKSNLES